MLGWYNNLSDETQRLAHVTLFAWAVFAISGLIVAIFGDSVIVVVAGLSGLAAFLCTVFLAAAYVSGD